MLRAFRGVAACGFTLATSLTLTTPALATPVLAATSVSADPAVAPGDPVPGAPDPNAPRVWSFWQSDGTAWLAGSPGTPAPDGAVLGWRFSASPDGAAAESPAGELPAFEQVCGKQAASSGHKRVAMVVDFGDGDTDAYTGDQPPAPLSTCVIGAENATGTQLLASAAAARVDAQGVVLAVNDYPAREKGGTPVAASAEASGAGGLPLGWIAAGAGALVLLGGGAVVATRRRARVGG
ncbi:SCO2322 family protein [Nonomuraea sp. NPDC046570]|uniref:SCO2322 family protein n=1 Tax=Nonomuraea sp. NPDC046570 TaxID=3155255 RepID=UPI0033E8065D